MKTVFKIFSLGLLFAFLGPQAGYSQQLPPAFLLGEDESAYDKLCTAYPRTLLAVSNNDLDLALKNWFEFLGDMDRYAKSINFEVKGMKLWLHVFWKEDGSIAHIGFFFLPNSRLFKTEEVKAFFSSFIRQYQPKMKSDRSFSHYTSASFPVLSERR